jgi:hypothetical protein
VVARLKKINSLCSHRINEPVLLGDSSGPSSSQFMLEGFRFADPVKGVSQDILNELQDAESGIAIRFHPPAKILSKFEVEYCLSMTRLAQALAPAVASPPSAACLARAWPVEEQ